MKSMILAEWPAAGGTTGMALPFVLGWANPGACVMVRIRWHGQNFRPWIITDSEHNTWHPDATSVTDYLSDWGPFHMQDSYCQLGRIPRMLYAYYPGVHTFATIELHLTAYAGPRAW